MLRKIMFPQPNFERKEWLNLNGTWEFSFDKAAYDRKIEVPYPWGSPLSGISDSTGDTAYYRKTVSWNPAKKRIFLVFGAVDYESEIKVNGVCVGTHIGGYDRFEFDVTDFWERTKPNVIELEVTDAGNDSQLRGKQSYGEIRGIWQTVWLEARPTAFIKSFFVRTRLDGEVTYEIQTSGACNGAVVYFSKYGDKVTTNDNKAVLNFKVEDPEWWSPENPKLYFGELVLQNMGDCDRVSTYFGIREIGTGIFGKKKKRYITLNGKPYYINGVLDQSFNPHGYFTLPSDDDCKAEIQRLKDIGINMTRIHIKAEEPLKLFYADMLGLLVMEDIPCFWGEPTESAKVQYEAEMTAQIIRDRNHPSVFCWVIFNETWGLFSNVKAADGSIDKIYLPETTEWVVKCYSLAKKLDPTRLVEDNSPCKEDHTVTDINTWHFYSNGYQDVKRRIDRFCRNAYVGSTENYYNGYTMSDVPCMNSECGNVWGLVGNAGESDISWQYKYMMNEFRLHDTLCGFVFTEFHDVPNEFNGYYKIDNSVKDFGYSDMNMSLKDLHSQDYVGVDYPPMSTVMSEQRLKIPMFVSSFTDLCHNKDMNLQIETVLRDPINGDSIVECSNKKIKYSDYGLTELPPFYCTVPKHDGIMEIRWTLWDGNERVMSNAILFDIDYKTNHVLTLEPQNFFAKGFTLDISAIQGAKRSGIGEGEFSMRVYCSDIPNFDGSDDLQLIFEASTRELMSHDLPDNEYDARTDLELFTTGHTFDSGKNRNSFKQTDETLYSGEIEIEINGTVIDSVILADCPADSRGALSHHYQPVDHYSDEAGSYGVLVKTVIPKALLSSDKEFFELTIRSVSDAGLSLYGRRCGRYGIGIVIKA